MRNSIDVVVDIETTGKSPGCAILAVGAASTDLEFDFYKTIWHAPQGEIYGLFDDPETMAWWNKQAGEAKAEAFSGTTGLMSVLGMFSDWLKSLPAKEVFVWGNGADFDQPILTVAYDRCNMRSPFAFNNRCYRTLKNLYREVKAPDFEGIKHHALWDARHEAKHLSMLLRKHFTKPVFQD